MLKSSNRSRSLERQRGVTARVGIDTAGRHIFLCCDQTNPRCCEKDRGLRAWDYLKKRLKELGLSGPRGLLRTKANCLRVCEGGPVAVVYPEGTYVVPMTQPYASFAQTLLEVQHYPDLREYPGGPPRRPYDVTAHTLPLLMDVEAVAVENLQPGVAVVIEAEAITTPEFAFELPAGLRGDDAPRIALYKSAQEPMTAGWTRWMFDQHDLVYDTLKDARARTGDLRRDYDVIVLQGQSASSIAEGYRAGVLPDQYVGGLGAEGVDALQEFVEAGGRLVAIEEATDFAVDLFGLGVTNAVDRLDNSEFYVPGSILTVELETDHPSNRGLGESVSAWFWRSSRAFEVSGPELTVTARYGAGNPLRSGWILGPEYLSGKPAVVEARVGEGSVVLIGFQPNYRSQSMSTWPLLFNAMDPRPRGRPRTDMDGAR